MLSCPRHIALVLAGTRWGTRKYLDMDRLYELERERQREAEQDLRSVAV